MKQPLFFIVLISLINLSIITNSYSLKPKMHNEMCENEPLLSPPDSTSKNSRRYFRVKYDHSGHLFVDQRWHNEHIETVMKIIGQVHNNEYQTLRVIYGYMLSDQEHSKIYAKGGNFRGKDKEKIFIEKPKFFLKYRNKNEVVTVNITHMIKRDGSLNYESVLGLKPLLHDNIEEVPCSNNKEDLPATYRAIRKHVDLDSLSYSFGNWHAQEQYNLEKFAEKLMGEKNKGRDEL